MIWQCEKEHIWRTNFNSVLNGYWCPRCSNKAKKTINDAMKLAKNKNGKCLNKEYINSKKKLKWLCEKKHIWEATYDKIRSGRWCP